MFSLNGTVTNREDEKIERKTSAKCFNKSWQHKKIYWRKKMDKENVSSENERRRSEEEPTKLSIERKQEIVVKKINISNGYNGEWFSRITQKQWDNWEKNRQHAYRLKIEFNKHTNEQTNKKNNAHHWSEREMDGRRNAENDWAGEKERDGGRRKKKLMWI